VDRYVLAWELSNSLDSGFCIRAWEQALAAGTRPPLISNTDQGAQFTSEPFLEAVESAGVEVSMDGRGRWMDNRFIERLWRSLKYEDIYLHDYLDGLDTGRGLSKWFPEYIPNERIKRWTTRRRPNGIAIRRPTAQARPWGWNVTELGGSGRGAGSQNQLQPGLDFQSVDAKKLVDKKTNWKGPALTSVFLAPFGSMD